MIGRKSWVLIGSAFCLLFSVVHLQAADVRVSWNAPTTNANGTPLTDLAGYKLYRGTSSGNYTTSVNVGSVTSYTITGLTIGQQYFVVVTAYDASGNESAFSSPPLSFTPTSSSPPPSPSPPPSNLVAAYNFDQGSGSTLTDVSGNGRHGTISGATWTTSGKNGRALSFDGTNDYVRVSDTSALDFTTGMTLAAWVRPTASQNGQRPIIRKDGGAYFLYASTANTTLRPSAGVTIGSTVRSITAANAIPVHTWSHLAVTYDGATLRLYVNGNQVASSSFAGTINNGSALRVGGDTQNRQYFRGRIDDVRLYNRALSTTEIQADRDNPVNAISSSTLVAGDASGTAIEGALRKTLAQALTENHPKNRTGVASPTSPPGRSTSDVRSSATELLTADHIETAEVTINQQWRRVAFRKPFVDPIVVAKAVSYHDASPAVVSIRGVDATGFELRLQSWQEGDGGRLPETAGYLVFERGRYRLADGVTVEAGSVEVSRQHPLVSLRFAQPFRVIPVVTTAVSSPLGNEALIGHPTRIGRQGFQFRSQPWATEKPGAGTDTIAYIAWEPSSGTIAGLSFQVGRSLAVRRDQFSTLAFDEVFSGAPIFLADIQAARGGNPLNLRWGSKDLAGIEVKIDEGPAADGGMPRPIDMVGFMVLK